MKKANVLIENGKELSSYRDESGWLRTLVYIALSFFLAYRYGGNRLDVEYGLHRKSQMILNSQFVPTKYYRWLAPADPRWGLLLYGKRPNRK